MPSTVAVHIQSSAKALSQDIPYRVGHNVFAYND